MGGCHSTITVAQLSHGARTAKAAQVAGTGGANAGSAHIGSGAGGVYISVGSDVEGGASIGYLVDRLAREAQAKTMQAVALCVFRVTQAAQTARHINDDPDIADNIISTLRPTRMVHG